jgi:hypothetical protein
MIGTTTRTVGEGQPIDRDVPSTRIALFAQSGLRMSALVKMGEASPL